MKTHDTVPVGGRFRRYSSRVRLSALLILTLLTAWVIAGAARVSPVRQSEVRAHQLQSVEGRLHLKDHSLPFTGTLVEYYPNGRLRSRSSVREGRLDGLSLGWNPEGGLQVREHFIDGQSHGLRVRWAEDGSKVSETPVVNAVVQGTFRKWHLDGRLAIEASFVDGKPHGVSRAWDREGQLVSEVDMRAGLPVPTAMIGKSSPGSVE